MDTVESDPVISEQTTLRGATTAAIVVISGHSNHPFFSPFRTALLNFSLRQAFAFQQRCEDDIATTALLVVFSVEAASGAARHPFT